jgi:hypothetical protein
MLSAAAIGLALLSPLPQVGDLLDVAFSELELRLICDHYQAACRQPRPDVVSDDGRAEADEREHRGESGPGNAGKGKAGHKSKGKGKGGAAGAGGLPPGLARRGSLPPGLQKQLDEKGRLPPGLQKRVLPDSLRQRLPTRGPEVEIVIVDRDVLLIQAATGLVYDAIAGVVRD